MIITFLGIKAIHLDQQGIERLFAFVVTATETVAAGTSDGINFIDEDQTRRAFARLLKHIPHATGRPDTDKHFNKVRTADAEEAASALAGDRLGEQRLSRAGGSDHQDTLGNTTGRGAGIFGILEELDQLGNFLHGFLDAGNILESGLVAILGEDLGLCSCRS